MFAVHRMLVLCAFLLLIGCRRPAAQTELETKKEPTKTEPAARKFDSPEAAFAAFKDAAVKQDENAFLECFTTYSLKGLVVSCIALGVQASDLGDAAKTRKVHALFDEHDLASFKQKKKTDETIEQLAESLQGSESRLDFHVRPVTRPRAFAIGIMNVAGKSGLIDKKLATSQLTNIVTNGNEAQGQLTWVVDGQPQTIPFFLKKQSDSWRIVWPPSPKGK